MSEIKVLIDHVISAKAICPNIYVVGCSSGTPIVSSVALTQDITYAALATLISTSAVVPGLRYKITDKGDRGIVVTGISTTKVSLEGTRLMLVPKSYAVGSLDSNAWKGVWHSTKTAAINDLMIWGGLVWKNLTGAIGSAIANKEAELDVVNWVVVPKASFSNSEYVEQIFIVHYDFEHDWIAKQFDDNGNEFGCSYEFYTKMAMASRIGSVNPVNLCDYNYSTAGSNANISNNRCIAITNNVEGVIIHGNVAPVGFIRRNKMAAYIANNFISSITTSTTATNLINAIYNNTSGSIIGNIITGKIEGNTCPGGISNNHCSNITNNTNSSISANKANSITGNSGSSNNINNNLVSGDISSNSNAGIYFNVVSGNIEQNSGTGYMSTNMSTYISSNVITYQMTANVVTTIQGNTFPTMYNNTASSISGNNTLADIYGNKCLSIDNNIGTAGSHIHDNANNGAITGNVLSGFEISFNNNNGSIGPGTLVASISDTIVNK